MWDCGVYGDDKIRCQYWWTGVWEEEGCSDFGGGMCMWLDWSAVYYTSRSHKTKDILRMYRSLVGGFSIQNEPMTGTEGCARATHKA